MKNLTDREISYLKQNSSQRNFGKHFICVALPKTGPTFLTNVVTDLLDWDIFYDNNANENFRSYSLSLFSEACEKNGIVLLLANTGLRVDELKTITWRNIDWDNDYIQLINAGKTRSNRRLLVRKTGMRALERIRERGVRWKLENGSNRELNANELVIATPNAKPINDFKKGFAKLLATAQIAASKSTTKHTLASLRHTYATFRLTKGDGVTMRMLALQMGTSERMKQRHYGHDNVSDYPVPLNS
ncbi:site-specific integrase [Alphaproteobacteria bacterium]|nr:site-specific integrase [Alphaproteobacteria bacterium]